MYRLKYRLFLLLSMLSFTVVAHPTDYVGVYDSLLFNSSNIATPTSVDSFIVDTIYSEEQVVLTKKEINEIRSNRGLADVTEEFVPKGQWIFGGSISYSAHNNDDFNFLILDDIDSYGYTVKFTPLLAYAFSSNMALGTRFVYGRSLLKVENANLSFGDDDDGGISLAVSDYYLLKQSYTSMLVWRQYIPLGKNKRFALFNEMQLQLGGSQYKNTFDSPVKGTYATSFDASLGISPGIVAFATNNIAFEVNVGIMGVSYSNTKQIHNQIYEASSSSSFMNFKINLLSIGLGVAFYL